MAQSVGTGRKLNAEPRQLNCLTESLHDLWSGPTPCRSSATICKLRIDVDANLTRIRDTDPDAGVPQRTATVPGVEGLVSLGLLRADEFRAKLSVAPGEGS